MTSSNNGKDWNPGVAIVIAVEIELDIEENDLSKIITTVKGI